MYKTLILILTLLSNLSYSQQIKLADMQLLQNLNADKTMDFFINKGWDFSGTKNKFNEEGLSFAYEKGSSGAVAWCMIFDINENANKQVSYQTHKKIFYLDIKKQIELFGYKFVKTETEGEQVISTYISKKFLLKIYVYQHDIVGTQYIFTLMKNNGMTTE